MELSTIKRVYFVGIGGIGMSALARYFKKRGCDVAGYDRTQTPLTDDLEKEGMPVAFEDELGNIPAPFSSAADDLLVIYTPAIPKESKILNYFLDNGFSVKKRSEVLGIISKGMFTVAVAGTHGKTTTSSMIAHIFTHSGFGCSAFLGGITSNYNTNFLIGNNDVVVVEADEYDRSFLQLHPDITIITSTDADHLDIYGDHNQLLESFRMFAAQLKPGGRLICKKGIGIEGGTEYSASQTAPVSAGNVRVEGGSFYFDFQNSETRIENIQLGIPGLHNIENSVAAIEAALLVGIPADKIKLALKEFKGVKRRFEYIIKEDNQVYIDDYAHHPEELRACITAVKSLYPAKKLTTIFQPHLFSRTRDFAEEFASVLNMTDQLILLDIYPARELPMPGVTSRMILEKMSLSDKQICGKEEAIEFVRRTQPALLLTVGAGDIDTLVEPLKKALNNHGHA